MRFSFVALATLLAVGVESFSVAPTLRAPVTLAPQSSVHFSKSYAPRSPSTQLYSSEAAAIPAPEESSGLGEGTATISNEIFNLVKGIVGAGVLSLPAGK